MPSRLEDAAEVRERAGVILDVLEHVHADDRVDPLLFEVGAVLRGERKPERGDADVSLFLEPRAELPHVVRLDVRRDDALFVGEKTRLVPHTRADLEDARPEPGLDPVVKPAVVDRELSHPAQRDRPDVAVGRLPAEVLENRPDGLEGVLGADLLAFLVRAPAVRDGDFENPGAHARHLARDLGLDAEAL